MSLNIADIEDSYLSSKEKTDRWGEEFLIGWYMPKALLELGKKVAQLSDEERRAILDGLPKDKVRSEILKVIEGE